MPKALHAIRRLWLALLLLVAAPGIAQSSTTAYVLGADDTIQIVVYGQPDASITTRIKSDGTVVMPLIGAVQAAGQTNIQLAASIAAQFTKGGYFKDPIVNIEIAAYASKVVNVAGRVTAPGLYPLDRGYRALDVLLKAGWIRDGGATFAYLRRGGAAEQRLDIEGLVRGDDAANPVLRPSDTLFVPDAELIFISGQVNRPGSVAITPGMTIRQAIAMAGGVTATGSQGKVGLVRGTAKETDVEATQSVQKNDVIIVKERLF
jgi:polysaccharide biosynthesis/export protein